MPLVATKWACFGTGFPMARLSGASCPGELGDATITSAKAKCQVREKINLADGNPISGMARYRNGHRAGSSAGRFHKEVFLERVKKNGGLSKASDFGYGGSFGLL